jgi:6-pyruvoyltetrahydropterin/6-carboxytetrahydropterin synthase
MSAGVGRVYFGRRYMLSASHRLHNEALSAEENRATYGKCNNPHGHGHNYVVEVLMGGRVDPETGMVVNMAALDEAVRSRVVERFDHTNLNLDSLFVNRVPTTENLTKAIFELLDGSIVDGSIVDGSIQDRSIEPAKLVRVRVEETENNFFEYSGESS